MVGTAVLPTLPPAAAKPCPKLPGTQVGIADGDPCCYLADDGKNYSSTWKNGGCSKPDSWILCFLGVAHPCTLAGKREEAIG